MALRMIQVGTGGIGARWCGDFLPPNVDAGLIEVVAAVDINPDALQNARESLGLSAAQCYTDIQRAFDENPADFCTVVVPPFSHEAVVDAALAHDLHILSEKPIADTLVASVRIADKVTKAGKKMAVTMSHRFNQYKTTLRETLRSGRYGTLNYLVCRFTAEARQHGSWGRGFRYEMADPLLVEGSVHHLDILADLAGTKCERIYAPTWNPAWSEFAGDAQALVTMEFENGVRATYEGSSTNAIGLDGWGREYTRAECEGATLILGRDRLECFPFDPSREEPNKEEGQGTTVPWLEQPTWGHVWLIEKFANWLQGGAPMETNVSDNLQSVAMVSAAIESSQTGQPINVQEHLAAAWREVSAA